jgi:hypothetical protein
MTILEQIYAIAKSLPQDQAREILTFAEFIQTQHQNADNAIATLDNSTSWEELVYSLAGTWAEDFPPLEEIRADLGEDILREKF